MTKPSDLKTCPYAECGKSLVGDEIPERRRYMYSGESTHGSLLWAIYDHDIDQTTHFQCPFCLGRIELDGSISDGRET